MSTHRLDTDALHLAVYARMHAQKLSSREAAAQMAISASTLTRLKHGKRPDADALVSLLAWLGRGAQDFTVPNDDGRG